MTIAPKSNILDIGFGGGINIKTIASITNEASIYGVDISTEAYKQASKINQDLIQKGHVQLKIADASSLPFPDQMFDLIIATQTHIYWNDLNQSLSECARVLKADGQLLISSEKDKINYHLPTYKEPTDFVTLLKQVGFSKVTVKNEQTYIGFICQKSKTEP